MPNTLQDERRAFDTHFNYIHCLAQLTGGLTLTLNVNLPRRALPEISTKQNLIDLTRKSLEDEYKIVQIDKDYSFASTSWLPIKGYYLLFNMMLTVEYLISARDTSFRLGHIRCIEKYTDRLRSNQISFSEQTLNSVYDRGILSIREVSGSNLSRSISTDRRYRMAMRKAAYYKKDDIKRRRNINLRTTSGRSEMESQLQRFQISLFEFPYYMRVRSNYRDFAFIEGITTADTKRYFEEYYRFIMNVFECLQNLKKSLAAERNS